MPAPTPRLYIGPQLGTYVVQDPDGALYVTADSFHSWRRREPFVGTRDQLREIRPRVALVIASRLGAIATAAAAQLLAELGAEPPKPIAPAATAIDPNDPIGAYTAAEQRLADALAQMNSASATVAAAQRQFQDALRFMTAARDGQVA